MYNVIEKVSLWIVKQLDALKMSSPILFVLTQALLVAFAGLLNSGSVIIPTPVFLGKFLLVFGIADINSLLTGILVATMALMGLHTTTYLKANKNA